MWLRSLASMLSLVAGLASAGEQEAAVRAPAFDVALGGGLLWSRPLLASEQWSYTERYRQPAAELTVSHAWNEHLRTEVGASRTGEEVVGFTVPVPSRVDPAYVERRERHTVLHAAQLWQFRRNARVHPQIGIGVLWDREERHGARGLFAGGDWYSPTEAETQAAALRSPDAVVGRFRPFAQLAVKAYFDRRWFGRVSLRGVPDGAGVRFATSLVVGGDIGSAEAFSEPRIAPAALDPPVRTATAAAPSGAAPPLPLETGTRIRVSLRGGGSVRGQLLSSDAEGIAVAPGGRLTSPALKVAWPQVEGVDRSLGRRRGRGAWIGAAVGGAINLLLFAAASADCRGCDESPAVVFILAPVLGGTGAIIGALAARERFEPVALPPGVGKSSNGIGHAPSVRITLSF